jgi:glycosyltransferase involved in cell wall biosynthesis
MREPPAISVLLPVRDAGPYLASSLASLWRQSLAEFEVVAIDDGSRDGSGAVLDRVAAREPRLRVVHTGPKGLPAALNLGLSLARSSLIARHDADDLSHRDRLALQRAYLGRHPEVAVVGCRVRLFPAHATGEGMRRWARWHNGLLDHQAMANEALIDSPLCHGTALIRRSAVERVRGWSDRPWAEDLDLWLRLIESGARLAKLPRVLYGWRQHRGSATRRDPRYGRERFIALKIETLARGPLHHAGGFSVAGTGRSLAEWTAALEAAGLDPRPVVATTPGRTRPDLCPPVILVFGTLKARTRWRTVLSTRGLLEGRDFIFVS